jgi:DNA processing protein
MLETGATLVPITSEAYPARLREIYDPPLALFARGRIGLLQPVILGVVGIPRTAPSAMLSAIFSGVIPWRRRSTIGRTIFR